MSTKDKKSEVFSYFEKAVCLFCRQNADNGLAGAIVPSVRSLAETK